MVPNRIFFTKGVGRGREELSSFEAALRDAGIARYNLVHVSSILPPNCKIIPKDEGLKYLNPGEIVYSVMARIGTNENSRHVAASIGYAIPSEKDAYGYLSEHHSFGETDEKAGDYSEDLAATMLAEILEIPFDPNTGWDERETAYKMSGKIVRVGNITQSAEVKPDGLWTTVVAAAVLIKIKAKDLEGKLLNP